MSNRWIAGKKEEFVRDVLRDFCLAEHHLELEFSRFENAGLLSFPALRDLLGHEMNKGLLWRLKDTSHHLFRNVEDDSNVGLFLDWGIGYIFHETMKLKEDAYQRANYAPLMAHLENGKLSCGDKDICRSMAGIVDQTLESIRREISRIRFIFQNCRTLFPKYLSGHAENELLARFFFEQQDLVRDVFHSDYKTLLSWIYGEDHLRMYLLAAKSLRIGGWFDEAHKALSQAELLQPGSEHIAEEREQLSAHARPARTV
jgi:hypothetical protein